MGNQGLTICKNKQATTQRCSFKVLFSKLANPWKEPEKDSFFSKIAILKSITLLILLFYTNILHEYSTEGSQYDPWMTTSNPYLVKHTLFLFVLINTKLILLFPEILKNWVGVQQGQSYHMGRRFVLVGHHSSDGITMRIPYGAGFDNYHKIICDDVLVPKFWRTWHTWANTKKHISSVIPFTQWFS